MENLTALDDREPPWPAPSRVDPPGIADERTLLAAFLDFHRATLLVKCSGLDGEQLARRACPPSTLSLLGLLRHLADVERGWFRHSLDGQEIAPIYYTDRADRDVQFDVDPSQAAGALTAYLTEVAAAREVAARHELTDTAVTRHGEVVSLRWILLHMIEEYAQHIGHADLLREAIDGVRDQ
ncbi:DUF664 domain-containing protein [Pengzhenrongella frigida]|uniref:DUF664 domain-containing protein n=1 Tax=Pengzhenrongella frigida TaxID=1259133 RepID=A0A4Q5MY83_9MICO|nr:DUF664 domain-containing protein [Cellulomonas sp. HLT2-17]RYV50620.1 DUF664 domain-containing protein [Cellulomonas sp. HLT2-17]